MANIIRCVLPDGIKRVKPFTVADYRDFILTRLEIEDAEPETQKNIMDELTLDYFPDLPESQRHYVFLKTLLGSIGKSKIPVITTCPICGKEKTVAFSLKQPDLIHPELKVHDLTIRFNYPEKDSSELATLLLNSIKEVQQGDYVYAWDELSQETKNDVISIIDMEKFESIIKRLKPIYFTLRSRCCDQVHEIVFSNLLSVFKLLISPDEIFTFYQINHLLTKHNYDLNSIMNMMPAERGYALSMVDKELSK